MKGAADKKTAALHKLLSIYNSNSNGANVEIFWVIFARCELIERFFSVPSNFRLSLTRLHNRDMVGRVALEAHGGVICRGADEPAFSEAISNSRKRPKIATIVALRPSASPPRSGRSASRKKARDKCRRLQARNPLIDRTSIATKLHNRRLKTRDVGRQHFRDNKPKFSPYFFSMRRIS